MAKFGYEGQTDVSHILVRYGRYVGLSHAKEKFFVGIFCRLSTICTNVKDRLTDRQTDHGTIASIK